MQTAILIGKYSDSMEELYCELTKEINVQLLADDFENNEKIERIVNLIRPDVVIVSLVGVYEPLTQLYTMLKKDYSYIRVITVGTAREYSKQSKFCDSEQFEYLERPIEASAVLDKCMGRNAGGTSASVQSVKNSRRKVLIIDDDPVMLRTTKAMLDSLYDVYVAPSGQKGLAMIDSRKPDVILLDYEMPQMDGKGVLEIIRNSGEHRKIPVIFLTGISDREHIKAILALRPNAYLLKPPVKEKLIDAISKQFS